VDEVAGEVRGASELAGKKCCAARAAGAKISFMGCHSQIHGQMKAVMTLAKGNIIYCQKKKREHKQLLTNPWIYTAFPHLPP
jgi:hypothetical protein